MSKYFFSHKVLLLSHNASLLFKLLPFILLYTVYLTGHFLEIMDIDAAQYAAISWEMMVSGEWLEVKERGLDYLDKPPLLFWASALMFKIFGTSDFAYRLLPVLSSLLGVYATYRLAKIYYSELVAYIAALLLASCQAMFLMNHDVRTDTMLTAFVAFSMWQLAAYFQENQWKNLILGSIGIGLAMLAKGPVGLVIPALAFVVDFAIKRQWHNFYRWQYLIALLIIGLVLLPMTIGLYNQYDLHPGKEAYGIKNVSGVKFYYWTQSFGRITGESSWASKQDPFFLVHSTLWSFLPWSLLLVMGYIQETRKVIKGGFKKLAAQQEILVWGGYTLAFLALSQSRYQLPHYIYLVYPLGAILTAKWIPTWFNLSKKKWRWLLWGQNFQMIMLWALLVILAYYNFPLTDFKIITGLVIIFLAAVYFLWKSRTRLQKLLLPLFFTIIGINFFLNTWLYPQLFKYQSENIVGQYVASHPEIIKEGFYSVGPAPAFHSLDYYARYIVPHVKNVEQINQPTAWVFFEKNEYENIIAKSKILEIREFDDFHISTLTLKFLNPSTRSSELKKTYLAKIQLNND